MKIYFAISSPLVIIDLLLIQVRGSPKASKVSFLQQKGLTETEIDEAFRRVPETPVPALPTATTQHPSSTLTAISSHIAPHQQPQYPQQQIIQHPQHDQPVRWSQVALGAGFAAASAYAVKSLVWPFVADKYTAWKGRSSTTSIAPYNRNAEVDGALLPSTDVNAVADAIRAQTAELASSIEALKALIAGLDRQRPASPEDKITASEIRQELHTIAASLNE
jgi:Pex14 N-terminal domain